METNSGISQPAVGARHVFDIGEKVMNVIGIGLIFFIMLSITVDVAYRTAAGGSITGVYELNELLMVGCFLVLAYTQKENGHVKVDFVTERLRGNARRYTDLTALFLTLLVCLIFLWQSILQFLLALNMRLYSSGIIEFTLWPFRLLVILGFFFLCIRLMFQLWDMATLKARAKT